MLFHGPPGTGKTSTIEAFVNELYGEENIEFMTMNINASSERGIEIVRNKIKNFVSTIPIHRGKPGSPKYKFVIYLANVKTNSFKETLNEFLTFIIIYYNLLYFIIFL